MFALKIMSAFKKYLEFLRPFTLLPPALGMLSGSFVALGHYRTNGITLSMLLPMLVGALAAAILNGASNGLNQIYDLEIDKVNKPSRPIPSGAMSLREGWYVSLFAYFAAVSLAYLLGYECFCIFVITSLFTVIYSVPPIRSKRHWLLAAFTIAIPRGVLLKVAGWSVLRGIWDWEPWYIGMIFGLFLLGANNTKDYADIKGDREGGCSTLPIRFGIKRSICMIAPCFVLPFALFPLGVSWGILLGNPLLLWMLGISLMIWGIYVVYLLLKDPDSLASTENHPSWTQMYLMMMYAQAGLAIAYLFR